MPQCVCGPSISQYARLWMQYAPVCVCVCVCVCVDPAYPSVRAFGCSMPQCVCVCGPSISQCARLWTQYAPVCVYGPSISQCARLWTQYAPVCVWMQYVPGAGTCFVALCNCWCSFRYGKHLGSDPRLWCVVLLNLKCDGKCY
jgi:hypothetical protein